MELSSLVIRPHSFSMRRRLIKSGDMGWVDELGESYSNVSSKIVVGGCP